MVSKSRRYAIWRQAECRAGRHLMTTKVRINGSEPKAACSWCGAGWPEETGVLSKHVEDYAKTVVQARNNAV